MLRFIIPFKLNFVKVLRYLPGFILFYFILFYFVLFCFILFHYFIFSIYFVYYFLYSSFSVTPEPFVEKTDCSLVLLFLFVKDLLIIGVPGWLSRLSD